MQVTKARPNQIFRFFLALISMALLEVILSNRIKRPRETLKVILSVYQMPKPEHVSFLQVFSLVVYQIILTKLFQSFSKEPPKK